MKTTAVFFPFDLFGSEGTSRGVKLLADAFREMLADNRRERAATRADAYKDQVSWKEVPFETIDSYENWRGQAAKIIRQILRKSEFLFWIAGNHLGALPLYEELGSLDGESLIVQLDAHLDVQNFSECTTELSHGNFLLHARNPLPHLVNIGHRDLLLHADYIEHYFRRTFSAADLALDPEPALRHVAQVSKQAPRVLIDIDCDVFDPAFFPAVTHPQPMGLSPHLVLRFIEAAFAGPVLGFSLSEFDPAHDRVDQSLSLLIWLVEFLLTRQGTS